MKKNRRKDTINLYTLAFVKELQALFKDKANMRNFERTFNLKTVDFPENMKTAALQICDDWVFDNFLFSVPEEFLDDRVEFEVLRNEKDPREVVSVSNGITRYEFIINYLKGFDVDCHAVLLER